MIKTEIGFVTNEEKQEIQELFERRNGLNELAKVLSSTDMELYERLVIDLGETTTRFQNWWNRMSSKYNWVSSENGHWEIDFETCKIYLVTPK